MKRLLGNRQGFILFSVIGISVIFIIILIPVIGWTVHEFSWTHHSYQLLRALNLADAGAELGVWDIVHNSAQFTGWVGTNPKTKALTSFTDNFGEQIGDIAVSVDTTEPDHYLIASTGFVPSLAQTKASKTVKVKVFPHALFNNGLFGFSSVTISGQGSADSYDASLGPYSIANSGQNADVGTNGTLTISGQGIIEGDIIIGPDGTTVGDIPSHVTGESFYSGNEVEKETVSLPGSFTGLPNLGDLSLSDGDTLTLSGNVIYQSMSLSSKAILTLDNNTNVYVVGSVSIAGQAKVMSGLDVTLYIGGSGNFAGQGIINTTGTPSDLQIYGIGSGTTFTYSGQADFYGTIYAPNSTISLVGQADCFGAVVGETVRLSGQGSFHYDESLSETGPSKGYDIAYWQED